MPSGQKPRMKLSLNGGQLPVPDGWQDESLLDVLREALGLVGAKFGCGVGQCGACTVLIDGQAVRSCLIKASAVGAGNVTTIEGLAAGGRLHPVQQAWLDEAVPQCGYCQSGQIMGTVALLRRTPKPSDADIVAAMAAHLCRCGTQQRIRAAVKRATGYAT
jgi:isoquinoline 1-oxidoreductase alpha subunit